MFASRKVKDTSVDFNQHAVDTMNQGNIHIDEPELGRILVVEPNISSLLVAPTGVVLSNFKQALASADVLTILLAHREFIEFRPRFAGHQHIIDAREG